MDSAITRARRAAILAQLLANAQLAHAAELAVRVRRQWPEPANDVRGEQRKEAV